MKILHQFEHLRLAQAFSDYLTSIHIDNHIEQNALFHQLILQDDEMQQQAESELSAFLINPNQDKYLSASWDTGKIASAPSQLPLSNMNLFTDFKHHAGLLTHSIFIICLLTYAASVIGLMDPIRSAFAFFMYQPFDYLQSWRFITPAFLHFSMLHIVFNLLWWWQLGGTVEKVQGKSRLLIVFVFSAITSNVAQFFLVGPYFGGLSGVVYGLVGYSWLQGLMNKKSQVRLPNNMFIFLLGWLALGFFDLLPVNVANHAHLFGLLSGLFLSIIFRKQRK